MLSRQHATSLDRRGRADQMSELGHAFLDESVPAGVHDVLAGDFGVLCEGGTEGQPDCASVWDTERWVNA